MHSYFVIKDVRYPELIITLVVAKISIQCKEP